MKQHLSKLACSALLGLGVAMAGSMIPVTANAQSAGALAEPLLFETDEAATQAEPVHYYKKRRHYRHYHRDGGVYFRFGNGSFSFSVKPKRYYPRYHRRYYEYPRHSSSRHVDWCYSRYRTYRHWDNTFQPYHGPRKQCISPYY
jgi:hypothetical protein